MEVSEEYIQAECYKWFRKTFPEFIGLLCYNLNNPRNKVAGGVALAMGLRKGRADFTFYFNRTAYFIEMKTETGTQSEDQIKWENIVTAQGYNYYICRNLETFQKIIYKILES